MCEFLCPLVSKQPGKQNLNSLVPDNKYNRFFIHVYVLPLEIHLSKRMVGVPLPGLPPPHLYACPNPRPGFSTSLNVEVILVFSELRRAVIVRFVYIGRIVDHHCLEVIVSFVNIGGIVDHHCLEVIVRFVDIDRNVDHQCLNFLFII